MRGCQASKSRAVPSQSLGRRRLGVLAVEALDTAGRVNNLVLSCKEGVAVGANINLELTLCAACLVHVSASTADFAGTVLWMDCVFHLNSPHISNRWRVHRYGINRCVAAVEQQEPEPVARSTEAGAGQHNIQTRPTEGPTFSFK